MLCHFGSARCWHLDSETCLESHTLAGVSDTAVTAEAEPTAIKAGGCVRRG